MATYEDAANAVIAELKAAGKWGNVLREDATADNYVMMMVEWIEANAPELMPGGTALAYAAAKIRRAESEEYNRGAFAGASIKSLLEDAQALIACGEHTPAEAYGMCEEEGWADILNTDQIHAIIKRLAHTVLIHGISIEDFVRMGEYAGLMRYRGVSIDSIRRWFEWATADVQVIEVQITDSGEGVVTLTPPTFSLKPGQYVAFDVITPGATSVKAYIFTKVGK